MATLKIRNNFEITLNGVPFSGKQGAATDDITDQYSITVDGKIQPQISTLATATARTVWDDDNDEPTDFDYLFFWADVDMYIQIIGSGTNVVFKVLAKTPFTMSYDTMLAAADTTAITGGTEPTLTDIDSIVIGNYSGSTGNYLFYAID